MLLSHYRGIALLLLILSLVLLLSLSMSARKRARTSEYPSSTAEHDSSATNQHGQQSNQLSHLVEHRASVYQARSLASAADVSVRVALGSLGTPHSPNLPLIATRALDGVLLVESSSQQPCLQVANMLDPLQHFSRLTSLSISLMYIGGLMTTSEQDQLMATLDAITHRARPLASLTLVYPHLMRTPIVDVLRRPLLVRPASLIRAAYADADDVWHGPASRPFMGGGQCALLRAEEQQYTLIKTTTAS